MRHLLHFLFLLLPAFVLATEENIIFASDGLVLRGTLSIPDEPGPHPVAILVHGSGPNDRNQTTPMSGPNVQCLYPGLYGTTIRSFQDIARELKAEGYAVLRYDKRTYTHGSTLDPKTITTSDFVTDILSAIDFVQTRPELDGNRVILVGHSQGSTLIPLAAQQRPQVKALISLAGPTTPVDTLLADQVRYIYRTCADSAQGEQIAQQLLDALGQVRAGTWPANQPISGAYAPFWLDWMNMTDSVVLNYQQANLPTLFLQGDMDFNVPVSDVEVFRQEVTVPGTDVWVLNGINHYLTTMTAPAVPEVVTDTMLYWLNKTESVSTGLAPNIGEEGIIISHYPGGFRIVLPQKQQAELLRLWNLQGQLVQEQVFRPSIEMSHLPRGVYLLEVTTNKGAFRQKVVW